MSDTITTVKNCRKCGQPFTAQMRKLMGRFPVPVDRFKAEPATCPECLEREAAERDAQALRRKLNFDSEAVKAHFEQNPPTEGQTLILTMFQHHTNSYRLVRVIKADHGRQKRIIIDKGDAWGGASYYRSGKSCFHPKGQTILLPYVEAVAARLSHERDTTLTDAELETLLGHVAGT